MKKKTTAKALAEKMPFVTKPVKKGKQGAMKSEKSKAR